MSKIDEILRLKKLSSDWAYIADSLENCEAVIERDHSAIAEARQKSVDFAKQAKELENETD